MKRLLEKTREETKEIILDVLETRRRKTKLTMPEPRLESLIDECSKIDDEMVFVDTLHNRICDFEKGL